MEVWTNGPRYNRKDKAGPDLSAYKDYVNNDLKKTSEFANIRTDINHLMR